jgi:hypothetical protein
MLKRFNEIIFEILVNASKKDKLYFATFINDSFYRNEEKDFVDFFWLFLQKGKAASHLDSLEFYSNPMLAVKYKGEEFRFELNKERSENSIKGLYEIINNLREDNEALKKQLEAANSLKNKGGNK